VGVPVGAVALRQTGGLVLAAAPGFAVLDEASGPSWLWTGGRGDRMNEQMRPGRSTIPRRDDELAVRRRGALQPRTWPRADVASRCDTANGLGWSPAGDLLYYADTPTERIDVFDYESATGTPRNRRLFVDLHDAEGRPDGLTVDPDGMRGLLQR